MTEKALRSSKTSVLARATWHNIPEDGILHSHRRENLTSYPTRYLHKTSFGNYHYVYLLSYHWWFAGIVLQAHYIPFQHFLPYWFIERGPLARQNNNYTYPFLVRMFNRYSVTEFMSEARQTWKHGALVTIVGCYPLRICSKNLQTLCFVFVFTAVALLTSFITLSYETLKSL
jgi:hypothetical protein